MAAKPAQRGRKTGPTIADVARLAGVSAQTVSRTSTGAEAVRPETRERVLTAMEQLGYSPNRAARALRNGRYGTIGLIARRFDRTGEARTTDALLRAAEAADYGVSLLTVPGAASGGWEPAARRLHHQSVDGLVIIRAEGAADEIPLPARMPVAVSDSRASGRYPSVVSDEYTGMRLAVDHLLKLGHRTVHHIAGPPGSEPARLRALAWRSRLEESGIVAPEPFPGDWTAESGYRAGAMIAADPRVTAVACANDETALGLRMALHEAGRRVPEDVSVVGFDDISLSRFSVPPLTTIRQDFEQTGKELVRLLLEQIEGVPQVDVPHVVLPTELVVRGTTAPPR
ncbi:LacI family DNA-binding transcriptional regulator, partial [Demequina sp.]|uniref:LacI family DNA-binding transcriptional regulator n=1 Tax=Demequina sp. TaxID=2050685 RepID=UPI0025E3F506